MAGPRQVGGDHGSDHAPGDRLAPEHLAVLSRHRPHRAATARGRAVVRSLNHLKVPVAQHVGQRRARGGGAVELVGPHHRAPVVERHQLPGGRRAGEEAARPDHDPGRLAGQEAADRRRGVDRLVGVVVADQVPVRVEDPGCGRRSRTAGPARTRRSDRLRRRSRPDRCRTSRRLPRWRTRCRR